MGHQALRDYWNSCRYIPNNKKGHFESYFQRANHPTRPLAFWIRYTLFIPQDHPENGIGELWGIFFDGEKKINIAVKEEIALSQCQLSDKHLEVKIGQNQRFFGNRT